MTSADHANTIRWALEMVPDDSDPTQYAQKALVALDALVAQAETAEHWHGYYKERFLENQRRAEAAEADAKNWSQRYFTVRGQKEAAEAERDRLREQIKQALALLYGIDYDEGSRIDRAVAALAGEDT